MAVPGPPTVLWATALPLWAIAVAVLGEAVRSIVARWVPLWRSQEPVERFLVDLYVGGAIFYLVASVPVGAFSLAAVVGLPMAAAVGLLVAAVVRRHRGISGSVRASLLRGVGWAPAVALLAALGLYLVEVSTAVAAPTGNTYDSSLLTTYTSLLLQRGMTPLSFHPYAASMILYPQGSTVWFGAAQLTFGLPAARTALLVTPLFLGLAPLAGYVAGRRLFGTDRAGATVALAMACLGPSSRAMVAGSNDFVLAFPLVLLLAAWSAEWTREAPPSWADAVGFGLLLGYSAALNPVGAEWLLPCLVGCGLVAGPRIAGRAVRWASRWGAAAMASMVPIVPSLYVLLLGLRSPGFVPGSASAPATAHAGISVANLIGSLDPFLFRGSDVELAPVPILRAELAILLVLGLGILLLARRGTLSSFARWALAAGVSLGAWLVVLAAAGAGVPVSGGFANISSGAELSTWLFAVYGLVASVPLVLLFDRLAAAGPPRPAGSTGRRAARRTPSAGGVVLPLVAVLLVLGPGVVLTPTSLASVERTLYTDFGNVSPSDFALLACAGATLPAGSRVLAAPGSAAEFLPGYARHIALLYPLVPGWPWVNGSYRLVVDQLSNATLNASGRSALAALDVGFIAVTQNNTVLWPAFSPTPMLADPANFTAVFHQGDAYLFATTGGASPLACP